MTMIYQAPLPEQKITFKDFCEINDIQAVKTPLPNTLSGIIYFDGTTYYIIANRKGINKKMFQIEAISEYLDLSINEKPTNPTIRLIESGR